VRRDITELIMKPGGGALKMGVMVQLNLFAQNRSGGTDLIPANMATWSSTDNRVGEVNSQGRLTPRGAGSVTIAATYADKKALATFDVID
jgi:Bacterial Ig-like domain (group 2)